MAVAVAGRDGQKPAKKYDLKWCTPKVEKQRPLPKNLTVGTQKGEKATAHFPLISFQILESGKVADAHVKRSSGFADIDKYALEWIRGTKYNVRSGCGVIETDASVSIHWTSVFGTEGADQSRRDYTWLCGSFSLRRKSKEWAFKRDVGQPSRNRRER